MHFTKLNTRILISLFTFVSALLIVPAFAQNGAPKEATSAAPFLGRWDVTLHTPDHDYGCWLEITGNSGELQGRMVGRWGHTHPVIGLQVEQGGLTFKSPKSEEAMAEDMIFHGKLVDGKLSGEAVGLLERRLTPRSTSARIVLPQQAHWEWHPFRH